MPETQYIEWKRIWKDDYLKTVCGFANARGGKIFIGKTDDGTICPVENAPSLLEQIPNKIKDTLGLTVDVNLHQTTEGDFLELDVMPQSVPVPLRGRYYYRSGSTTAELTGSSLNEFLLRKSGTTWDATVEPRASFKDVDTESLNLFLADARKANRLPPLSGTGSLTLLEKLRLAHDDGLTHAGIILFAKDPARFYPGTSVRIGRFGDTDTDLRFQEVIEGNLMHCLRQTLTLLDTKFLVKPVRFEGIQRIEEDAYPMAALREVLLNALVHRRYSSGIHTQIRVYDDRISFWNDGLLPEELSIAALMGQHASRPRNPLIAEVCFKAGYIDTWGRGIEKITQACQTAMLPAPRFEEADGGFRVTLFTRSQSERATEDGRTAKPTSGTKLALSRHQVVVLRKCLMPNSISDLMKIAGRSDRTKFRNQVLRPLLDEGLIEMTLPDKPTSSLQQYRTTKRGRTALSQESKA
jgi:ATP-dependent DNA helicase RecG